jgi:deoxyguanosine kinase
MERNIAPAYLTEIQEAYFDYFKSETETPVVVLNLQDADFQRDPVVFDKIITLLKTPVSAGVHFREL